MNFIDEAFLEVRAGNGGAGASSFRREKYIPFGGPDGGDGGKGGDIIFQVNKNKNTLIDFQNKKVFIAKNGRPGSGKNKSGAAAEDLVIDVPKGTVIYDDLSNEQLLDCCDDDVSYTVAVGGDGGQGNARFKSSTNQAPRKFTLGFEGEIRSIRLELKSLADVGLVGFPNAGKSTLLSVITAAKPKIADYAFTTLKPNLGIVEYREFKSFVMADIPGIIEGAAEGKGLGHRFLRHIERNSTLLFLIPADSDDIHKEYEILLNELKKHNPELLDKQRLLAISKTDMLDEELQEEIKNELPTGIPFVFISSLAQIGLQELKDKLWKMLN